MINKIKSSETINLLKYLKKLDKNSEFYFFNGFR